MIVKTSEIVNSFKQYWPEAYDSLALPLRVLLFQAHSTHEAASSGVVTRHGLSLVEFSTLSSLRRTPPPHALTPSEIQHSMLITSGGLTKILVQLEERGLVTRPTHDGDRRIKPVALTERALQVLDETVAELNEVVFGWFSQTLNGQEMEQLATLLNKLTNTEFLKK